MHSQPSQPPIHCFVALSTACVRASSSLPRSIAYVSPARCTSPSQLRAACDTVSTFSTARTSPSERDHHSSRERRKNQSQLASRLVDLLIATGFNFVKYETHSDRFPKLLEASDCSQRTVTEKWEGHFWSLIYANSLPRP